MKLSDEQIVAELVRCRRPGMCALESLKAEHGITDALLTGVAFRVLGICVETAVGIMAGFDGPNWYGGATPRHRGEDYQRGVRLGSTVREAVQP